MNELIHIEKTQIGAENVNSVNARNIHTYLEVKTAFSHWIKRAIEKYDFVENEDYTSFITDAKSGKRDFIVSMDMAKELCLVENNPKGKETRKYFIRIEKQVSHQVVIPQNPMEALAMFFDVAKEQNEKLVALSDEVEDVKTYIDEDIKTRPVSYQQQKMLQDAKMAKVYEIGKQDTCLIKKLHSRIWSIFKKRYALPRYSALPASKFEEGLEYIRNLTLADMV